jgi:Ca2+-binding RTX toxin-like protein
MMNGIEQLESRVLCSVTLRGGTLAVVGTSGNDTIDFTHPLISAFEADLSRTRVDFGSEVYFFKTRAIKRIVIFAGDGENRVDYNARPRCNFCGTMIGMVSNPYPFSKAVPRLLIGGAGTDIFFGGLGRDVMIGGDSFDVLHGQDGDDSLIGGNGNDAITGGKGNDVISGGNGNDILQGMEGDDTIFGGFGDDTLYAESPGDQVLGGDGDDLVRYGVQEYELVEDPVSGGHIFIYPPPPFEVPSDIERTEAYLDLDNPWVRN